MYEKFGQFINGKWQASEKNETYDVINPATEEIIGKASKAGPAGIHNGTPEYAMKMIDKGFNFVTISSDQRTMGTGAKAEIEKIKGSSNKEESKSY